MVRHNTPPAQKARDTSRAATDTRQTHENRQEGGRRDGEYGHQRAQAKTGEGLPPTEGAGQAATPAQPETERGDAKRPYKRAGH